MAAAVSVDYFSLGTFEQRDAGGNLLGQVPGSVTEGSIGFGGPFFIRGLRAGLSGEYVQESLFGATQSGYGGGLGLLYDILPGLSAGAALNHLGAGMAGFSLPSTAQGGLALRLPDRRLILALDYEDPFNGPSALKAGAEEDLGLIILRAGYRQDLGGPDSNDESGLSAGLGIRYGHFRLDYSYTPYGALSTVQRFEATVELPQGFFESKVVYLEGTSETAQSYFKQAQAFEAKGDILKALVQYQRCLDNYPSSLKASPQPFYVTSANKVTQLQASLTKSGDHAQIHALTLETMAAAEKEMKAGHFRDAINRLQQAKKLDPLDAGLDAALKADQGSYQAKVSGFRDAAQFAAKENDLDMSVDNYRKLLDISPDDDEAQGYLTKHRAALKTQLQSIERRGSYFYIEGKLEEAIKAWSDGEALDYFNDVDFKRDLDKARKQQQLLQQEGPTPTP